MIRVTSLILLIAFSTAFGQTEVEGEVSGEWTAEGSPYIVVDSTWVPEGEELLISRGVTVQFQPGEGLYVYGTLNAIGAEEDSIHLMEDGGYLRGGFSTGKGCWLVRREPDPLFENAVELFDPAYPSDFVVEAAFPNPFNGMVTIPYLMPVSGEVKVTVYDSFGRRVALLLSEKLSCQAVIRSPGRQNSSPAGIIWLV